ncbi:hypothetical protein Acr_19g0000440 [Actinidia rufa]|uniref:DUF4283 domain-containing protein n=1 Tax=Actinidia rufa TaxID=165716 RepID=A0A7J0G8I1_9ERIC|nr:hypothetical protein Acr_19g0000440 [Actinidia rufa]
MGKGNGKNKHGNCGSGSNQKGGNALDREEVDPILVAALARPETSLRGGMPKKTKAALEAHFEAIDEEVETVEESVDTSRTLGEEDSDCSPGICQKAQYVETVRNVDSDAGEVRTEVKKPQETNRVTYASLPVRIDAEDVENGNWSSCLVGYFGGRFPGKKALHQLVNSWREEVSIHFHSSGWIMFKFDKQDSRDRTLQGGLYMVFGRPLLLKVLPDYFNFNYEELSCFPIWIQFKNLPLELWRENPLSKIYSKIGKPVYTDKLTGKQERISFARVLVEADVAKLVSHTMEIIMTNGEPIHQSIFYENMPLFCSHCKTVGHATSGCKILEKFAAARNEGAKIQSAAGNVAGKSVLDVGTSEQAAGDDGASAVEPGQDIGTVKRSAWVIKQKGQQDHLLGRCDAGVKNGQKLQIGQTAARSKEGPAASSG